MNSRSGLLVYFLLEMISFKASPTGWCVQTQNTFRSTQKHVWNLVSKLDAFYASFCSTTYFPISVMDLCRLTSDLKTLREKKHISFICGWRCEIDLFHLFTKVADVFYVLFLVPLSLPNIETSHYLMTWEDCDNILFKTRDSGTV
jgi:hypothetical protein